MIYTRQQVREAYERVMAMGADHEEAVQSVALAMHVSEADVEEIVVEVCHG